jgi:hypothetical protein
LYILRCLLQLRNTTTTFAQLFILGKGFENLGLAERQLYLLFLVIESDNEILNL